MATLQGFGITPEEFYHGFLKYAEEFYKKQQKEPQDYLTADEVCSKFQITKETLHQWRKKGIAKAYRLGARKVYYRLADFENAMELLNY